MDGWNEIWKRLWEAEHPREFDPRELSPELNDLWNEIHDKATDYNTQACPAISPEGWWCTLPEGHEDTLPHIAASDVVLSVWRKE